MMTESALVDTPYLWRARAGTPDLTEEVHEGTSPLYFAIVDERVDVVIGRDAL